VPALAWFFEPLLVPGLSISPEGVVTMARPGPQTQAKRQREQKKREKRLAKKEKMEQRKALKESGAEPIPSRDEPNQY